ncbi:hypothetical protein [Mameliella alba]|uniref:hypothetical protein n=1 Tax=Mameliella alba TaxID=561184 RepID=UPI000B52FFA6|nr:hypothetical protein [Mameliella alba]OWV39463.1 hypothetical protein CDZ95_25700 [Mameliella alba]OWV64954.1 hypothetical protein CDZ97_08740 [Mameliella alba]
MAKPYKKGKRGAGRFVQLHEYLQKTAAWRDLKPGPRALYLEIKRRYTGTNNGRIVLSHREAAEALNVHRNTIGPYFTELIDHGFIRIEQGAYLGPDGVGKSALLAITEAPTHDGKPATKDFMSWSKQKPGTKSVTARHNSCDVTSEKAAESGKPVLKIVTR